MPGSRKQPIAVVKANGKKHLTKKEIYEREQTELKVEQPESIVIPNCVPKKLRKDFKKYAQMLIDLNIYCELDADTLAKYLISQQLYEVYTDKIFEVIADGGDMDELKTVASLHEKAFGQAHKCASALGMTISSRCKLVVPKKDDPAEKNPFLTLLSSEGDVKNG